MEACRVVIVTYQGVQSLDVAGPLEVFAGAGRAATACGGDGSYLVQVASVGGGMVRSESGLSLGSEELRDIQGPLGLLVLPGGGGVDEACRDEELRHEVTRLASETSRLATVCSGTLLAAACGLLEGRIWGKRLEQARLFVGAGCAGFAPTLFGLEPTPLSRAGLVALCLICLAWLSTRPTVSARSEARTANA